jgi:hypothetical protein
MKIRSSQVKHAWLLAIALGLFLGACSSRDDAPKDGTVPASSPTISPTRQNTDTPEVQIQPTATPEMESVYILGEGEVQVTVEPPSTFSEFLEEKIEEGVWERGEGLVSLLSYLAGETGPSDIPGVTAVVAAGATGLLREAQDYVADPPQDSPYPAEINRLLDKLIPSQEELDRLSEPAGQSRDTGPILASFERPAQGYGGCEIVSGEGFSKNVDPGEACYKYRQAEAEGKRYRVYYPRSWDQEEAKLSLVDSTLDALTDSAHVYSGFGYFGNANAVFSMTQPEDSPRTLAFEVGFPAKEPCPITILPLSLESGSDAYKQTLAHESFHCFQDWNFNMSPYSAHKWWGEGTAEYFSNVVYPEVNDEHGWLWSYYSRSITQPWFDMSYHNFLLFQFLGNRLGNSRLISLLREISAAGGIAGEASVLASYPEMDALFEEFVVATMSRGVQDTGGGMIVSRSFRVIRVETVDREAEEQFIIDPFVAGRFLVKYEKEKRFLEAPVEDEYVRHSAAVVEERGNPGSWSELPPEVRSGCDEDERYLLAISSVEAPGTLKADINTVEVAECDPCLLGVWDIDADSFEAFMDRLMEQTGIGSVPVGGTPEIEIGGHDYLQFGEDGRLDTRRVDFTMTIGLSGSPGFVTSTDAQGSANYSADGEELKVTNGGGHVNSVETSAEGQAISTIFDFNAGTYSIFGYAFPLPGVSAESGPRDSETAQYTCDEHILEITLPEYGEVRYNRVEQIIPTRIPTPSQ